MTTTAPARLKMFGIIERDGRYAEMVQTRERCAPDRFGATLRKVDDLVPTGRTWPLTRAGWKAAMAANEQANRESYAAFIAAENR